MTKLTTIVAGPFETNTWIVTDTSADGQNTVQKVFIVDAGGSSADLPAFTENLAAIPCGFVLTHGHLDHLSLLPALKQQYPDMPVYIHEADAAAMGPDGYDYHRQTFENKGMLPWVSATEKDTGPLPVPDGILHDGDVLPFAPEWKVIHTPGHTQGCICLYNETEHLLISGDTMFRGTCGRTDLMASNSHDMKLSLQRLLKLPADTRVYPGHGSTTTIGDEIETYCFL